jgi:hypothetical protein
MLDQIFSNIMNEDMERRAQVPPTTDTTSEAPETDVPEVSLNETESEANDNYIDNSQVTDQDLTTNTTTDKNIIYSDAISDYEYPMTSYKGSTAGKTPGLTKESKTKHGKLYDVNMAFMNDLNAQIADKDFNFIYHVFDKLAKKPVVNGKSVELSTLKTMMSDPSSRKALMDQAIELEADPSLDSESRFALIKLHHEATLINGELLHARKLWTNQLRQSALMADEKKTAESNLNKGYNYSFHQKLFKSDGTIRTEREYNNLIKQETNAQIAEWDKNHPMPEKAPLFWQRTDQPNPMMTKSVYNPITKKWENLDSRPKMENSQEGWNIARQNNLNAIIGFNHAFSYDELLHNVITEYDLPDSPATKFRTEFEGKFNANKGGGIQGTIGTIDFDATSKKIQLRNGTQIDNPEIVEYGNLLNLLNKGGTEILVQPGNIAGNLPDVKDASVATTSEEMKGFLKTLTEDYNLSDDKGRKRSFTKLPRGTITFASVAGGENGYYAYNLKFHSDYIDTDRFKGSEDAPKIAHKKQHPELLTDGFTIYVPKKLALGTNNSTGEVMSKLARDNERATTVSPIEGLFTVSNDVKLHVPNAGQLNLTKDEKTGETSVSGFTVALNPNSGIMDTVHFPIQIVPADKATDLDWITNDFYRSAYNQLSNNDAIMNYLIQKNGVRDPKILKANLNNQ